MPDPSSFQHAQDCVLGARGSAYLPSACLASHGLQGMAGPALSLPRLLQPPPASEGSSQPLTPFSTFLKGGCSFPAATWRFGKQLSPPQAVLSCAGCSEMPEERLCKVHAVFIRPV